MRWDDPPSTVNVPCVISVLLGLRLPAQILLHKWPAVGCAANFNLCSFATRVATWQLTCKKSTCKASISAAWEAALSASIDVNTHDSKTGG